ncbi:hypothetical protein [Flagellimonas sp. GZD32]|uniref:hypothetical protein n=1 Tax=Flagellimonas cixiensis TaxID=3228750 RepID=UPI0035C913B0
MKKLLFVVAFAMLGSITVKAQTNYRAALGLGIDLMYEGTFFGATGKYFFSDNHVGQADFLLEDGGTLVTFLYSYHNQIVGARGLRWYAGVGPSIVFVKDFDNIFALRPHLGLDFKVNGVPFVVNFDWRPAIALSETWGNEIGAFGFGMQFAFD